MEIHIKSPITARYILERLRLMQRSHLVIPGFIRLIYVTVGLAELKGIPENVNCSRLRVYVRIISKVEYSKVMYSGKSGNATSFIFSDIHVISCSLHSLFHDCSILLNVLTNMTIISKRTTAVERWKHNTRVLCWASPRHVILLPSIGAPRTFDRRLP